MSDSRPPAQAAVGAGGSAARLGRRVRARFGVERLLPDGVCWFGAGGLNDGVHISLSRLIQAGYSGSEDARGALLRAAASLRSGGWRGM